MCGIAGLINLGGKLSPDSMLDTVGRMADCMVHRGPDDSGAWVDPTGYCAFSQRRLSIIDISPGGHQPMESADRRACITFNGEIYNFLDVKEELIRRGIQFRSTSDTEVLLEAIRLYSENLFARLDGMYAFAFFSRDDREVLIARDPFGEKPLYYTEQNGYFAFASELQCLEVLPGFQRDISQEALTEYLAFQYVPSPRSMYRAVKKLPPGHFLRIDASGKIEVKRHFAFQPAERPQTGVPLDQLADELEDILVRSIRRRMISDVPLGAFLSSGVDSATVVALVTKVLGRKLKTFSMGVHDSEESEHYLAREMGKHLGSEHHDMVLSPDIPVLAKKIGGLLDEPNADSSCLPTYLLSQFARRQVTVVLSGDGGDEMFCGYSRYFQMLDEERRALNGDPAFKNWKAGSAYFSPRILVFPENDVRELVGDLPPASEQYFTAFKDFLDRPELPLYSRLRQIDMNTYLPGAVLSKVDRMSMQHALEVRAPILSIEVARFAEKLMGYHCSADGLGKQVLKEVASRYIPRSWLDRRKLGFGVPVHLWNRADMLRSLRRMLLAKDAKVRDYFDPKRLEAFVLKQETPGTFSAYQVWTMIILEEWLTKHLSPPARPQPSLSRIGSRPQYSQASAGAA
ncbi:MAG: asparagine synthase (glutamine-hydrolyzing) [Bdellovibrionota bacterium]